MKDLLKTTAGKLVVVGVLALIGAIVDFQFVRADIRQIKAERPTLKRIMCATLIRLDSIERKLDPNVKREKENVCSQLIN